MVSTCPKQRRVQDEEGLASKLEIGELQSAILCTFIVPRDSAIAVAGSDAAKNHVERMKTVQGNERRIDALGPIHVHVCCCYCSGCLLSSKESFMGSPPPIVLLP